MHGVYFVLRAADQLQESDTELEIREDSDSDSDAFDTDILEEHSEVSVPQLPSLPDENSKEINSAKTITVWLVGFLLRFQTKFHLPDSAVDILIKFLFTFFFVLSRFSPFVALISEKFPKSLHTVKNVVNWEVNFTKFIVCTKCNALYKYDDAVTRRGSRTESKHCSFVMYPEHPYASHRKPCGNRLLKTVQFKSGRTYLYPHKMYCYKSIQESLQCLLLQAKFYSNCQSWRFSQSRNLLVDIFSGRVWKDFQQVSGSPFLALPFTLAVMLNVDWFQPFTHTAFSVGVLYLSVMNLPRHLRYKRENIIIVGIIPGPNEPQSLNPFLQPLVKDLKKLWKGVNLQIQTPSGIVEQVVHCAVLGVGCDIPAARKACGFLGHSAKLGCSKCFKEFPGTVGNMNYSGFDRSRWVLRTDVEHRQRVKVIQECKTKTDQAKKESQVGCRYSVLLDLPYFDATRLLTIDPMHNLFLGSGKHMLTLWMERGLLTSGHFKQVQSFVDSMLLPSDIGRIPQKISSGFASFKADQFKNWIILYSIPALSSILPDNHLECWRHFVLACRRLCQQSLSTEDINIADALLIRFCKKVEQLYGEIAVTPNMHLHGHLKDVILDYGPIQEFWLFSFERYNGILGKQPTNNRAIEQQLMKRFLRDNHAVSFSYPDEFKNDFKSSISLEDRLVGSVLESVLSDEFRLPSKSTRGVLTSDELSAVHELYCKLYPNSISHSVVPNSVCTRYSTVTLRGRPFGSAGKGKPSGNTTILCTWEESVYGSPPTSLPDAGMPHANARPVNVHCYLKVMFTITDNSCSETQSSHPDSLLLAYVSWLFPHPARHFLGKPAQLWCSNLYETFGMHSFVPLNSKYLQCRCAHGPYEHNEESLIVIVPLVE